MASDKKYDSRLFRDLSGKDVEDARRYLATNFLIERLREILKSERDSLEINRADYDSPSWAYKQAHVNGEYLAYQRILKILGEKED